MSGKNNKPKSDNNVNVQNKLDSVINRINQMENLLKTVVDKNNKDMIKIETINRDLVACLEKGKLHIVNKIIEFEKSLKLVRDDVEHLKKKCESNSPIIDHNISNNSKNPRKKQSNKDEVGGVTQEQSQKSKRKAEGTGEDAILNSLKEELQKTKEDHANTKAQNEILQNNNHILIREKERLEKKLKDLHTTLNEERNDKKRLKNSIRECHVNVEGALRTYKRDIEHFFDLVQMENENNIEQIFENEKHEYVKNVQKIFDNVTNDIKQYSKEIDQFSGKEKNADFHHIKETLGQLTSSLDKLQNLRSDHNLKTRRKQLIEEIQNLESKLEEKV